MNKILVFISLFSILIFFTSCDRNRVFEEYKTIPENLWYINNKVTFDVNISDTVSVDNLYINIRNSGSYSYSNLFVFLTTYLPDNTASKDTLECTLADASGKWLGNGLGDIWDNKILFKRNFRFPHTGKYRFEMVQGMRINPLPLIADVGLRIEKVK
jgi:gliding motility-associated lipoprotein GldH